MAEPIRRPPPGLSGRFRRTNSNFSCFVHHSHTKDTYTSTTLRLISLSSKAYKELKMRVERFHKCIEMRILSRLESIQNGIRNADAI